ncbi:hypothetical protein [Stenotrophomonas maltophilia]|uniref:hypothetical protein n=1 Tax=Stenotrophomonas maltophilia TaxID=40324 RepID=UPI0038C56ABE
MNEPEQQTVHPEKDMPLTPKQRGAALSLAAGSSGRQAAQLVGVSPQTLSEWCQRPEFIEHVNSLILRVESLTCLELVALRQKAVERLIELLSDSSSTVALKSVELALKVTALSPLPTGEDDGEWRRALDMIQK